MSAAALALAAAEEGGASAAAPDASGKSTKSKKGARPCFRRNLQAGSCMTGRQTPVRRGPAGPRLEPGVPRLNPWKITLRLQGASHLMLSLSSLTAYAARGQWPKKLAQQPPRLEGSQKEHSPVV
ncbi:hypothetical protein [Human adenovirus sp.]|nr:hypothetical protein [Human adenovirus sp.]